MVRFDAMINKNRVYGFGMHPIVGRFEDRSAEFSRFRAQWMFEEGLASEMNTGTSCVERREGKRRKRRWPIARNEERLKRASRSRNKQYLDNSDKEMKLSSGHVAKGKGMRPPIKGRFSWWSCVDGDEDGCR